MFIYSAHFVFSCVLFKEDKAEGMLMILKINILLFFSNQYNVIDTEEDTGEAFNIYE